MGGKGWVRMKNLPKKKEKEPLCILVPHTCTYPKFNFESLSYQNFGG